MMDISPIRDPQEHGKPNNIDWLIAAAPNPRDKAFIALLARDGIRISEAIQVNESDIDFNNGTLNITHLKQRVKLKCPTCSELMGKRHLFCPGCGNKVSQAIREQVEKRRKRVIPIDRATLLLLADYLKWRRQFPYRGSLVFPFTRQRGWQLVERIGRRAGIPELHPHSLRHWLATRWVSKGLDTKKLQVLLGHANFATTMAYVDTNYEQLKSEYDKLWEKEQDESQESKGGQTED